MLTWTYTTVTHMGGHIERWDTNLPHLCDVCLERHTGDPRYVYNDTYVLLCSPLGLKIPLTAQTDAAAQRQAVEQIQKVLKAALASLDLV